MATPIQRTYLKASGEPGAPWACIQPMLRYDNCVYLVRGVVGRSSGLGQMIYEGNDMNFTSDEVLNAASMLVLVGLVVFGYLHYRLDQRTKKAAKSPDGGVDAGADRKP